MTLKIFSLYLDHNHPIGGLFAIIAMIIGFTLSLFGIKLFRFVIGVTGFLIFSVAGYIILINIHLHSYNFQHHFDRIIVIGTGVFGLIGACLSGFLWKWILLGLGAFSGISLGLTIFSITSSVIYTSIPTWIRPVILGALALIGALLLKRFERPLIIFSTAILGSLLFSFGLDSFLATGFDLIVLSIISATIDPSKLEIKEQQTLGIVLFWVGMTIVGIVTQIGFTGKNVYSHTRK